MIEAPKNGDLVKWWDSAKADEAGNDNGGYITGTIDLAMPIAEVIGDPKERTHYVRVIDDNGEIVNKFNDEINLYDRYINVYSVDQNYGGAEEGGWWYDTGEPLASIPFNNEHDGQRIRAEMTTKFKDPIEYAKKMGWRRGRHSVIGDPDIEIYSEDGFAQAFPTERPHYE